VPILGGDILVANREEEDEGLGSLVTPRPFLFVAAVYTVTAKVVAANHSSTNHGFDKVAQRYSPSSKMLVYSVDSCAIGGVEFV
jgi:hypothetical protein